MSATPKQPLIVKLHEKYYDLTKFKEYHPGGRVAFKSGVDITSRFESAPKHTDAAMYLLQSYKVDSEAGSDLSFSDKFEEHESGHENVKKQQADLNKNIDTKEYDKQLGIQMDESMEHLVNWDKPLLPQVWRMDEHYYEWVHRPVDRPFQLVQPQWLDELTKAEWWHAPLVAIPIATFMVYLGNSDPTLSDLTNIEKFSFIGSGMLIWTFIEYFLHRNLFHMNITGNCKYKRTLHFLIHGCHHKLPFCKDKVLLPPVAALLISYLAFNIIGIFLPRYQFILAGAVCGYLIYEMMHYYSHFGRPTTEGYLYFMKRFHLAHHFSGIDIGFGVTSSFWDGIFQTRLVLVKLKHVIQW